MNDSEDTVERFDWHEYERPSVAIAMAVGEITDQEPTELSPIYDVVDPGALNALLDGYSPDLTVTFPYEGCIVEIESDGNLLIKTD